MSKRTFLGIATAGLSEVFRGGSKKSDSGGGVAQATAAAQAKIASEQAAASKSQTAKQVAAINTPSKGFGSNSLENLSRSFLLRL